jgi:peptidyl-prolyl cis-trans isomerase B (cyclophilin B)
MKKRQMISLLVFALMACSAKAQTSTSEVLLETTAGNIRIALFDETPQHRDNFLKLVEEHVYDSLLFHRVIKNFMIQAGDLHSKHAQPGQRLGSGDYNYTVEAEFRLPKIFHRRGMVAMAREGDRVNPERRSSACQFYIVWGRVYNDASLMKVQERLDTTAHVQLTPEMQEVYKTVGGIPHLDGQYTVFGEVTEGLDVVDRIQQSATDQFDRPLEDIRILRATVTNNIQADTSESVRLNDA